MTSKKLIRHISLLIGYIFLISFSTPHLSPLEAADTKKELSEIQKELKAKKEQVKESIKKEKSVIENIEDIEQSIKQKERELRNYDKRISLTRSEMQKLTEEIDALNNNLSSRQENLKERLMALYKQQYGGHALILISANDYQDLIKKSKYINMIAYYDSKLINQFSIDIKEILSKKDKLESLNATLTSDKNLTLQTQKALETDRSKKDKILSDIRSKRQSYEKKIEELEKASRKLREMLDNIKAKDLPAAIAGKGFAALKGHLPWPVNGKVAIPFGKYKDTEFNITVYKNGIELQPENGEQPKAIAGGRVVYSDWFKGYGLLLIIDHGSGYHSLYGNLSEIFLNTGDILIAGTVVGKIGQSSILNSPALYFEIRHKGKPVDPMEWLKGKGRTKERIRIK